jgi:hypothetical protein
VHLRPTLATLAILGILGILCISRGRADEPADPTPGDIKLLPGYKHQKEKGIDTRVGKVWKEGALAFEYDIGRLAGNAVKGQSKDNLLWSKEQIVEGHTVQLALTKDRMLYATFPQSSANFFGKVKTDEDVADMLLMVLTYVPPAKPK